MERPIIEAESVIGEGVYPSRTLQANEHREEKQRWAKWRHPSGERCGGPRVLREPLLAISPAIRSWSKLGARGKRPLVCIIAGPLLSPLFASLRLTCRMAPL